MSADQFQFFLTEARSGWLESRIVTGDAHYDLSVHANFSEPLKDLFQCLCDTHGLDAAPDDGEYRHLAFEWVADGWLYEWTALPLSDGKLALTVEFKGSREVGGTEYPVWKIKTVTSWRALAEQVFTQASEMLWMYGFSGYLERWTKDFPAGQMMRLGHLLHGQPVDAADFARELGYLAETR